MIPKIVVQDEAVPILRDFRVRYKQAGDGLYTVEPAELIAKLATGAIDAGAKIILGVHVDDVIFRCDPPRVAGV
jgi:thiamine thiazole synthase